MITAALGEEAQVDYGPGPMVRDPQTGKYGRTRLFVLTPSCSREFGSFSDVPFQCPDRRQSRRDKSASSARVNRAVQSWKLFRTLN